MNAQEIFEIVANHLFEQDHRSVAKVHRREKCVYRAPDGSMCAVGVLIPDAEYDPFFDDGDLTVDQIKTYLIKKGTKNHTLELIKEHPSLLRRLQVVHDESFNWVSSEHMRSALTDAAKAFELDGAFLNLLSFKDR